MAKEILPPVYRLTAKLRSIPEMPRIDVCFMDRERAFAFYIEDEF
jgi:hypothetical protein